MNKIAILVDSGAGLTQKEAQELDIKLLEMPMIINGTEYTSENITIEEICDYMENDVLIKTSQPIMGEIIKCYDLLLEEYDYVIYIPLSSKLSGTYNVASSIAKNYDGRVVVIDALFASYVITVLALEVRKLVNLGFEPLKIKELVETKTYMWAGLLPYDLKYLRNGGRISKAAAALGNLLKIVPILKVEDGGIDVYDKVRTRKKAISKAIEANLDCKYDDYIWLVLHANCLEEAKVVQEELSNITGQEVIVHELGAVIMSHTGPKTIGIGKMRKIDYEN